MLDIHPGAYCDPLVCTLRKATLTKCRYQALSYAWAGQPQDRSIQINGRAGFLISRTLEDALRRLRDTTRPCTVWADAVCINQGNEKEKQEQLHFMGTIYGSADTVCIWLGELARPLTAAWMDHTDKKTIFDDAAFLQVASQPKAWWQRLWVIQEYCLSQCDPMIYLGSHQVPSEDFFFDLCLLRIRNISEGWEKIDAMYQAFQRLVQLKLFWKRNRPTNTRQQLSTNPIRPVPARSREPSGILSKNGSLENSTSLLGTPRGLLELVNLTELSKASDPRDKIFGLLGFLPNEVQSRLSINYAQPVDGVYADFVEYSMLMSGELDVLCEGYHSRPTSSWLPDFSQPRYVEPLCATFTANSRSCPAPNFKIDKTTLTLTCSGIKFDCVQKIAELPFLPPFSSDWKYSPWNDPVKSRGWQTASEDILQRLTSQSSKLPLEETDWRSALNQQNAKASFFSDPIFSSRARVANQRFLDISLAISFTKRQLEYLGGRAFFTTSTGFVGVGPKQLLQGDLVVFLFGASLPFVLRPSSQAGCYALIGNAFVHGFVDVDFGMLLGQNLVRAEQFTLR